MAFLLKTRSACLRESSLSVRSTKPDFLARLAISRKESWETIFWLRLAIATSIVTKEAVAWELDEAHQLKAMITAAIKTGQGSDARGGTEARGGDDAPVNG